MKNSFARNLYLHCVLWTWPILGQEGTLYETVEHIKPDVIALGYDQAHSEKDIAENCQKRNLNVRVVRLNTPVPAQKAPT